MKKEEKQIICKKCKEHKENIHKRRYPTFFLNNYCDECFESVVRESNKGSKTLLLIVFIPLVIALIADLIVKPEFPLLITILTYAVVTFLFCSLRLPQYIYTGMAQAELDYFTYSAPYLSATDASQRSLLMISLHWGFKLIVLIIRMFAFVIILAFNVVKFVNTALIMRKVDEKIRVGILSICSALFVIITVFVIGIFIELL